MGWKIVYRVTYPNGKTYIGSDLTDTISYFGSPDPDLVAADFNRSERTDMTVRREILWLSEIATDAEVRKMEFDLIRRHRTNDPAVGYNQRPKP
jgi:hypothetical protein